MIVNKENGNNNLAFNREVFLFLRKRDHVTKLYWKRYKRRTNGGCVRNISLEPTSKEKASDITDYDKSILAKKVSLKTKVIPLKKIVNDYFI